MKDFYKKLVSGAAIGAFVALTICYLMWSLQSLRSTLWFFVVMFVIGAVFRYLSQPDYLIREDGDGNRRLEKLSLWQKILTVFGMAIGIAILGSLIWLIGYGVELLLGWSTDYWELYLLFGICICLLLFLLVLVIMAIRYAFKELCECDWTDVGYYAWLGLRWLTKWLVIVACSVGVAGAILYYVLPLVCG